MSKYDLFIEAIHGKVIVKITADSQEKGLIVREAIPYDYGPSRKYKDGADRYHFYDLDSPDGSHNLSILPEQLIKIELLGEKFDPADYVKWQPNWIVKRDWGKYS